MEFKTNIPIYLQVIEDIKQKIIAGTLPLGSFRHQENLP